MCDYSLQSVRSRPAKIADNLTVRDFGTGTRGFAAFENPGVAVCVLPGTELAFAHEVKRSATRLWPWHDSVIKHKAAIFRQINKNKVAAHHDALEFPDGQIVLLTSLSEGQRATVLQLPAEPKTVVESEAQRRADYVGRISIRWPPCSRAAIFAFDQASQVFGRDAMPIYISRGRFTSDAVKGMLAKPENREEAVAKLVKSVGGRLIGWYLTFGHYDWLSICEFPDEKAAASAVLAAAAGG